MVWIFMNFVYFLMFSIFYMYYMVLHLFSTMDTNYFILYCINIWLTTGISKMNGMIFQLNTSIIPLMLIIPVTLHKFHCQLYLQHLKYFGVIFHVPICYSIAYSIYFTRLWFFNNSIVDILIDINFTFNLTYFRLHNKWIFNIMLIHIVFIIVVTISNNQRQPTIVSIYNTTTMQSIGANFIETTIIIIFIYFCNQTIISPIVVIILLLIQLN